MNAKGWWGRRGRRMRWRWRLGRSWWCWEEEPFALPAAPPFTFYSPPAKVHSPDSEIYVISRSLDYAGIGINMAFSPIPACYYGFYCDQPIATTYITLISISGVLSFSVSLIDWFQKEEHFKFKAGIFLMSGIVSVAGLIHFTIREVVYNNYGDGYSTIPSLYLFIPALGCYGIGFLVYIRQ